MSPTSPHFANPIFAQSQTQTAAPSPPPLPARKTRKMSITQTYFLAHKARGKLSTEASRADHNLRLLVGHANLLDCLMLELADAEREQESWFNQSLRGATTHKWADSVEEPEADWHVEDADSDSSDSDSDMDDDDDVYEDVEMADVAVSPRRTGGVQAVPTLQRHEPVYAVEQDDEDSYADLTLTRTPSHTTSPPELDHDLDSSDDEAMPPSPPSAVLPAFSEKQAESIATSDYYDSRHDDKDAFYDEGFYLPPRNPARLGTAISVF